VLMTTNKISAIIVGPIVFKDSIVIGWLP